VTGDHTAAFLTLSAGLLIWRDLAWLLQTMTENHRRDSPPPTPRGGIYLVGAVTGAAIASFFWALAWGIWA
jgi:hypothetical protein